MDIKKRSRNRLPPLLLYKEHHLVDVIFQLKRSFSFRKRTKVPLRGAVLPQLLFHSEPFRKEL